MTKDEFDNLLVGSIIEDTEFNVYGEVRNCKFYPSNAVLVDGEWKHIPKEGKHIRWDDGDNSCVAVEDESAKDIANFELTDYKGLPS